MRPHICPTCRAAIKHLGVRHRRRACPVTCDRAVVAVVVVDLAFFVFLVKFLGFGLFLPFNKKKFGEQQLASS